MSTCRVAFLSQCLQSLGRLRSHPTKYTSFRSYSKALNGSSQQKPETSPYCLAVPFSKSTTLRRRLDNESLGPTASTSSRAQNNGSENSISVAESVHTRPETPSEVTTEVPSTASNEAGPSTDQTKTGPSTSVTEAENYHLPPQHENVFASRTPSMAQDQLRPIVIDGQNVSFVETTTAGEEKQYSYKRLCLCIDYFRQRGHRIVRAVVPRHFQRWIPREIQEELLTAGTLILTPSRRVGDHANATRITPYDDNYIVQYAALTGAVIVTNDQYHDLYRSHPEWREAIRNRLLNFTWMDEILVFPTDPMGRSGGQPTLEEFLRFPENTNRNSVL